MGIVGGYGTAGINVTFGGNVCTGGGMVNTTVTTCCLPELARAMEVVVVDVGQTVQTQLEQQSDRHFLSRLAIRIQMSLDDLPLTNDIPI